ncbi:hypothetical protein EGJ27_08510 [Pseudomonas sp. v388]|nr:hypothetical protein EGJ27_08510 [Pseudomonas sp. v388]
MRRPCLRDQVLPPRVKQLVLRLLGSVEAAETIQALRMAEQRADGFVLGLETSGGYSEAVIEDLYLGFEKEVGERLALLKKDQYPD